MAQIWNDDDGERWAADADRRDRVLAPVGEALLTAAGLRPGEQVLDVGCGCGATTLLAAGQVSPGGTATGLDVSAPMLRVASARQESGGPANGRFVHADAQTHPMPGLFDVVISRFGTMFFTDPVRAFTAMGSALRPGGRMVLATWQPPEVNAWLTVPGEAIMRHATAPVDLRGRSMFTQSDPAAVEALLTRAGFVHVRLEDVRVPLHVGADVAEAVEYLAGTGPGRAQLAAVADADRDAALADMRTALTGHAGPGGVRLEAAVWIVTAFSDAPRTAAR
ncbi:class I SAM-dependent methyltransferase [Herbidospora mongoliensis]|uniref:class I SAM-dependent methyltransferase n=1 Tax=Herbidospora mongoliensis TaxID=688067 RepID=UPI000AF172F8|nr:class I SAM-dependent methyltransferase [Herbidospora mongoliensis]